jgi:ribosomal protein S11
VKVQVAVLAHEAQCNLLARQSANALSFAAPAADDVAARAEAFSRRQVLAVELQGVLQGFVWAAPVRRGTERLTVIRCLATRYLHAYRVEDATSEALVNEVVNRCPFGRVEVTLSESNSRELAFYGRMGFAHERAERGRVTLSKFKA